MTMSVGEELTLGEKLASSPKAEEASLSTFIRNLYAIVENPSHSDIISWNDEGDAIVIKDQAEFGEKILPIYFKHCKLSSFIRQMNMYHFRKKKNPRYEHVFAHPYFLQGRKDLLGKIQRKSPGNPSEMGSRASLAKGMKEEADLENSFLKAEIVRLKQKQREFEERIYSLEATNIQLVIQNQNYLQQLKQKSETEENLRKIINATFKAEPSRLNIDTFADQSSLLLGISPLNSFPNYRGQAGLLFAEQIAPGQSADLLPKPSNNIITINQNFTLKDLSLPSCGLKHIPGFDNISAQDTDSLPQLLKTLSEGTKLPPVTNVGLLSDPFLHPNLGSAIGMTGDLKMSCPANNILLTNLFEKNGL